MMPNRLLRDGVCTSDPINALSPEEEILFYRLLVVCDDFGHMDGRPAILKADCFPLKDSATPKVIQSWINGLATKGLIGRYTNGGKAYIAISKWEHRVRTHPKYPKPDAEGSQWIEADTCQPVSNLTADCAQVSAIGGLGLGRGKGLGKGAAKGPLPVGWLPSQATIENLSREFGLRVPEDVDRYVAAFRDACEAKNYQYADFDAAFRNCVRQDWPRLRESTGKAKVAL